MDVERGAEIFPGHRRALDVPTRTARAVRRRPRGRLGLGLLAALPQGEVSRVALAARIGIGRRLHVVDALPGEFAVRRPRADVEVDVTGAISSRISVAALDQQPDQFEDLGDVSGRARFVGRAQHVDRGEGDPELMVHLIGQVEPGPTLVCRLGQDLVVDVGDVADERDVVPLMRQPAPQHVEVDRRTHMSDVRLRLNRQPTHVDPRSPGQQGDEIAHVARRGVVKPESHPASLGSPLPSLFHPRPGRPVASPC